MSHDLKIRAEALCRRNNVPPAALPPGNVLRRMSLFADPQRTDYLPFLQGACGLFALQLHLLSGWTVIGYLIGDTVQHFAIQHPDGWIIDAGGSYTENLLLPTIPKRPHQVIRRVNYRFADFLDAWKRSNHRFRSSKRNPKMAAKALTMIAAWPGHYGFLYETPYETLFQRNLTAGQATRTSKPATVSQPHELAASA